jgi:putative FmdB family regulatory protein
MELGFGDRRIAMPTYEYTCQKCGHAFECVQSMTAAPLDVCPKESCPRARWGKGKVKRGIGGGAGLIFKGSGFYITDYRSEGYKAAAKADSGKSGGDGGAKSGGDAKPAAPSAPATPAPAAPTPAAKPKGNTPGK